MEKKLVYMINMGMLKGYTDYDAIHRCVSWL